MLTIFVTSRRSWLLFSCNYYLRQQGGSHVIVLSVTLSLLFCKQDNWRMRKRTSTKLGRHGQVPRGDPPNWLLLAVIRICVWISDHFFIFFTIAEYGIFWTFVSISHTINGRFVLILMPIDKIMHSQHFGTDPMGIRIRLIRKSEFVSRITFGWNFGVGGAGLRSLGVLLLLFYYLMLLLTYSTKSWQC